MLGTASLLYREPAAITIVWPCTTPPSSNRRRPNPQVPTTFSTTAEQLPQPTCKFAKISIFDAALQQFLKRRDELATSNNRTSFSERIAIGNREAMESTPPAPAGPGPRPRNEGGGGRGRGRARGSGGTSSGQTSRGGGNRGRGRGGQANGRDRLPPAQVADAPEPAAKPQPATGLANQKAPAGVEEDTDQEICFICANPVMH